MLALFLMMADFSLYKACNKKREKKKKKLLKN